MRIRIAVIGNDTTVLYAADELVKYLKLMDPTVRTETLSFDAWEDGVQNVIWLGMDDAFAALSDNAKANALDDSMYISVDNAAGVMTGSSPRMVLSAAYRFLKELGCDWVRPGPDGEIIPARRFSAADLSAHVDEAASYRHRGVTIEGAVSYEHVMNMVEWLPKAALNCYFIQFQTPFTFFDRWYSHYENPLYEKEPLTRQDVQLMHKSIVREIKKRGLMYHAVGHGWTCGALGVPGDEWRHVEYDLPADVQAKLALVDGKREMWKGVALNTNLCYSRSDVRAAITDTITEYCLENREVDYLHFWLADGSNNNCECPECQKKRPADFYVMMLNELDEKLAKAGLDTKVVFLVYEDLLWAPETEKLVNPQRFVLMFAPINRTYSRAFTDGIEGGREELAPFVRNRLVLPKSVSQNIAALSDWQKDINCDSFDFDYHLMWDHLKDPGYAHNARVLFEDMKNLDKLGLNGMVSCQLQRVGLPDALPIYGMAAALWDKTADFDKTADTYFAAAFGRDGDKARAYLEKLSDLFTPPYLRLEMPAESPGLKAKYDAVIPHVDAFRNVIAENIAATEGNVRASWEYLDIHAEMAKLLAPALSARCVGDKEGALRLYGDYEQFVRANEDRLYSVLDVYQKVGRLRGIIKRD